MSVNDWTIDVAQELVDLVKTVGAALRGRPSHEQ